LTTDTPPPVDLDQHRRAIRTHMMDVIEQSAHLADRIPAEGVAIKRIAREAHEVLFRQESAIRDLARGQGAQRVSALNILTDTQNISMTMLADLQSIARRRAAFGKTDRLPNWSR
jgi:hypothetical protein